MEGQQVILLNSDYSFLNTINWKKAVRLMAKGKVEVLKTYNKILTNAEKTWEIIVPKVLRLIKLVRSVYRLRVPFSRKNVLYRDEFTCQYCGKKDNRKLTIDHIIPKAKGGKTEFENCVAACKPCNNTKGSKTPREAKMSLLKRPVQPTVMEFLRLKMKTMGMDKILKDLGVY